MTSCTPKHSTKPAFFKPITDISYLKHLQPPKLLQVGPKILNKLESVRINYEHFPQPTNLVKLFLFQNDRDHPWTMFLWHRLLVAVDIWGEKSLRPDGRCLKMSIIQRERKECIAELAFIYLTAHSWDAGFGYVPGAPSSACFLLTHFWSGSDRQGEPCWPSSYIALLLLPFLLLSLSSRHTSISGGKAKLSETGKNFSLVFPRVTLPVSVL